MATVFLVLAMPNDMDIEFSEVARRLESETEFNILGTCPLVPADVKVAASAEFRATR